MFAHFFSKLPLRRVISSVSFSIALFLWSWQLLAADLARLDSILTRAPNLGAFLADEGLINDYYQAAADYYGAARFPRTSFDAIIGQIRLVNGAVPEFQERAWESENLGRAFHVTSVAPTFGRTLNQKAWDNYRTTWKAGLKADAGDLAELSEAEANAKIASILRSAQVGLKEQEAGIEASSLKSKEKKAAQGKLYQALKEQPGIKKASAYLVLKNLERPTLSEALDSGIPDLILNSLKELEGNSKPVLEPVKDLEHLGLLNSSIKARLPQVGQLLDEKNLFPLRYFVGKDGQRVLAEAGSASTWEFKPAPRRFHAFFKGIPFNECVGGDCTKLSSLTPERWATAALKNTEFHYVEKGKSFEGWVQAVPILHGEDAYASLDLAAPAFRQSILERDPSGALRSNTMLGGWLREATAKKPAQWKGYVVSNSNAINNGGALPAVRSSPSFLLGTHYNQKTHPFSHSDVEMVNALTNVIPLKDFARNYGGSMIFDAAVQGVDNLTVLKPADRSLHQLFKEALAKKDNKYINQVLKNLHSGALGHLSQVLETLRDAGSLKLLTDAGFEAPLTELSYSTSLAKYLPNLLKAGYSFEELNYAVLLHCHTVAEFTKFKKALLASSAVYDSRTLLEALKSPFKNPTVKLKAELEKFRGEQLDAFLKLKPDYAQLIEYDNLGLHMSFQDWARLLGSILEKAKNAEEFSAGLKSYNFSNSSHSGLQGTIGVEIEKSYDRFLSLNPNEDQLHLYLEKVKIFRGTTSPAYEACFKVLTSKLQAQLPDERNAGRLLEVLEQTRKRTETLITSEKIGDYHGGLIGRFLATKPTHDEIARFEALSPAAKSGPWSALLSASLESAENLGQFMWAVNKIDAFKIGANEEDWRSSFLNVLNTNLDHFLKLRPGITEIKKFRQLLLKFGETGTPAWRLITAQLVKEIEAGLNKTTTTEQFLKVLTESTAGNPDDLKAVVSRDLRGLLELYSSRAQSVEDFLKLRAILSKTVSAEIVQGLTEKAVSFAKNGLQLLDALDPVRYQAQFELYSSQYFAFPRVFATDQLLLHRLLTANANQGGSGKLIEETLRKCLGRVEKASEALALFKEPLLNPEGKMAPDAREILRAGFARVEALDPRAAEVSVLRKFAYGTFSMPVFNAACSRMFGGLDRPQTVGH